MLPLELPPGKDDPRIDQLLDLVTELTKQVELLRDEAEEPEGEPMDGTGSDSMPAPGHTPRHLRVPPSQDATVRCADSSAKPVVSISKGHKQKRHKKATRVSGDP